MRTTCLVAVAVTLAACGDDAGTAAIDAPGGDASAVDAAADAAGLTCGTPGPAEMACGGTCVDTSSDPGHCGNCTTVCGSGTPSCAGGECVAPLTTVWEHHIGGT